MRPTSRNVGALREAGRFVHVVLGCCACISALAQIPGSFTATARMITPRFFHTATLLPDGKTLIAGGNSSYTSGASESSAELYDPVTATFTATGSMTTVRNGHTATLLPSGEVLIAGGGPSGGGGYSVASAELYNPASGTFRATGDMTVERSFHTATLLRSGKVLIAGGLRRPVGGSLSELSFRVGAELYDPDTGTFSATGDMNEPSCDTATLLANGKVLITRGIIYDPVKDVESFVRHAELYDPVTGTFSFTGDTVTFHSGPTATLLLNGKVLIAGGDVGDGDGASRSAELYDPANGTFAPTGNLTAGREQTATTLLSDGKVLFAGGHCLCVPVPGGGYDNLNSGEIYNPATGAFSPAGAMITGRDILDATLLTNGSVLITGGNEYYPYSASGRDPDHPVVSTAELYIPTVVLPPPVLLSRSDDGRGQGAILHASTHQLVSPDNPGVAGEPLEIYLTGLTENSVIPPQVFVGGRMAEILFFGAAPGYPGLNQVNVRVPGGLAPASAVPVRLAYLDRSSNEVTIGVR